MNTDNKNADDENDSSEASLLKQEEHTDKTLLGEFGLGALAGLSAFISAVLTTVVEGHTGWRFFWLAVCIICLVCSIALIAQGTRNFGKRP
jgi:hypothetical protein